DLAAQRDGIVVDDRMVSAELAKPSGAELADSWLALDPETARAAVRAHLIAQALVSKYLDRLSVTYDAVTADSKAEAVAKAHQLAAGPRQADAVLAAEQFPIRDRELRAALRPQQADEFPFGTPVGQVVAQQISASPERWQVVRITGRDTNAVPVGGVNPSA